MVYMIVFVVQVVLAIVCFSAAAWCAWIVREEGKKPMEQENYGMEARVGMIALIVLASIHAATAVALYYV